MYRIVNKKKRELLFLGRLSLIENKIQTAVINIVSFRIFINLTFRTMYAIQRTFSKGILRDC